MRVLRRDALKLAGGVVAGGVAAGLRGVVASGNDGGGADPMVFLTVEVRGLCLFVADRKATLPDLGIVYGLLPNTAKLTSGTFDAHTPLLKVMKADTLSYDPPDREINGELQYGLVGQDVTLAYNGAMASGSVTTEANVYRPDKTRRLDACPPYDAKWSDVAFIADLEGILAAKAIVDPAFVQGGLSADAKIATRVTFAGGALLGGIPSDSWGRHIAWGFNKPAPNSQYQQAITDTVEFHVPTAKSIQFVLTSRASGGPIRRVTLKASVVRASIHNVADMPRMCDPNKDKNCPPHHFFAYYELLKPAPADTPTPGPMFLCGSLTQVTNTDPPVYCPPPMAFY
jgi:hypothetical protein